MLPAGYQRGYSELPQEFILGLLASARSIDGVRRSLRQMGASVPEADLQQVVDTLVEELALLNIRTPRARLRGRLHGRQAHRGA